MDQMIVGVAPMTVLSGYENAQVDSVLEVSLQSSPMLGEISSPYPGRIDC